tara:strand:+ start:137 stop:592 length:456 start_codon:yes stop_codon:yes gene_type:complete
MIVYFIAALAIVVHKSDTNRAAIFLFALFYSINELLVLDESVNYFLWSIISSTCFIFLLSKLSRVTYMILLLAITDIILTLIDLIALVAYNLDNEWLYQSHFSLTYYVVIAQIACLLVTDARSVNFSSIRYNLSLYADNARRFFVHRSKIH